VTSPAAVAGLVQRLLPTVPLPRCFCRQFANRARSSRRRRARRTSTSLETRPAVRSRCRNRDEPCSPMWDNTIFVIKPVDDRRCRTAAGHTSATQSRVSDAVHDPPQATVDFRPWRGSR
jgi:hypothetical protein